jgi:2-phosphoglycolate phosphatase
VPRPRAVLFDVDGTILDAVPSIRETMNRVLAERGQPTFTKAELLKLIGNPLRVILATKCPDPAVVEAMTHRYRDVYGESAWVLADLYPGVERLLADLHAAGVRTGVVTSKGQKEAERLLFDVGVLHLVDVVVGDDDARPLKPDPAPVLSACEALGVAPAEAAMVGDTRFDILAGIAAGAQAVGVTWGIGSRAELKEAGADVIVSDVKGLRRVLLG